MSQQTTLQQYANAVTLALTLPHPTAIYRAIMAGTHEVDNGLRGTAYDGDRVTGGSTGSHPERMLAQRHPGQFPNDNDERGWETIQGTWGSTRINRAQDDLLALRKATDRALDAISALNAICRDAPPPDDWNDTLWHCQVLLGETCDHPGHQPGDHPIGSDNPHDCQTLNTLSSALDIGHNVDHWALRFTHAIDTVRAIRDSWMAHTPQGGLGIIEQVRACRSHQRIGIETERATRILCRWCYRQVEDLDLGGLGDAVELQLLPQNWPSEDMLRSNAEGRRAAVARDRRDWLTAKGLDPAVIDRRRSMKRAS